MTCLQPASLFLCVCVLLAGAQQGMSWNDPEKTHPLCFLSGNRLPARAAASFVGILFVWLNLKSTETNHLDLPILIVPHPC